MKIMMIAIALTLYSSTAFAGRFDVLQYECEEMESNKEGIRCAVVYIDGMGRTLLIRIISKTTNPDANWDRRVKYLIGRTIQNFLAMGGVYIKMRAINPEGQLMERYCTKIKRWKRLAEHCNPWHPADMKDEIRWP